MAAEPQQRVDPVLGRRQAQLLETADLVLGEVVEGEVRQRGPAPEGEGLLAAAAAASAADPSSSAAGLAGEPLEARRVNRHVLDDART